MRVLSGPGDGKCCDILILLQGIGYIEALRGDHVIQLPVAHVIQIQRYGNRLDRFHIRSDHINVLNGSQQDTVSAGIVCDYLDRLHRIGRHHECADNAGIVSLLVADRQFDSMRTCRKGGAVVDADFSVGICRGNFVAVHIGLCGGGVNSGVVILRRIISNCSREIDGAGADRCAIVQSNSIRHSRSSIGHIAKDRRFAVLNYAGVIKGDIVDVDREIAVDIMLILEIVVKRCAVPVGDIELEAVIAASQRCSGIRAGINGDIMPAGFIERVYNTGTTSNAIIGLACNGGGSVCDFSGVAYAGNGIDYPSAPKSYILIRNIHPHAQTLCTHTVVILLGLVKRDHLIAGFQRVRVVDVQRQSVVAAVDLTIFFRYYGNIAVGQIIVVAAVRQAEAVVGSVLKVNDHVRTFAQNNLRSGCYTGIRSQRSRYITGDRSAFISRREGQAAHRTNSIVCQGNDKIVRFCGHSMNTVSSSNFELRRLSIGNREGRVAEHDGVRNDHMDGSFANHITCIDHLNHGIAHSTVGSEHAILNITHAAVRQLPGNIARDFCRATSLIGTNSGDTDTGAGSNILMFRSQRRTIENTIGNRSRNNDETIGNGTLRAVAGAVGNNKVVGALGFCAIGTGTAAIQVSCPNTSQIQHNLCLFLHSQADGFGGLVAVSGHQDNLTVCGDANGLTRILCRIVQVLTNLTVNDQHGINTDRFLNILGIVGIIAFDTDLHRAILHDGKVASTLRRSTHNAVHNEDTSGLTGGHVVVGCVDARDNSALVIFVTGSSFLIERRNLLGKLGHTKVGRIHVLIGRKHFDRINARVCRCNKHLDLIAIFVIHSVCILRNTRRQRGFLLCRNGQLREGKCSFCGCHRNCGHHGKYHRYAQQPR